MLRTELQEPGRAAYFCHQKVSTSCVNTTKHQGAVFVSPANKGNLNVAATRWALG